MWIKISDLGSFVYLQELPQLETLNLSGNPLCKASDFYETMIMALPELKMLNGKASNNPIDQIVIPIFNVQAILSEERQKLRDHHKNLLQLAEPLVQNYINITFMESLVRRLDLHYELLQKNSDFSMAAININTFLGMLNQSRDVIFPNSKAEVIREVYSLARGLRLRYILLQYFLANKGMIETGQMKRI